MPNQTVGDAARLLPFFYERWSRESPDGNMLDCSEGEFDLRKRLNRCSSRLVAKFVATMEWKMRLGLIHKGLPLSPRMCPFQNGLNNYTMQPVFLLVWTHDNHSGKRKSVVKEIKDA